MTLVVSFLPIIPMILLTVLFYRFFPSWSDDSIIDIVPLLSVIPFYPIVFATFVRRLHDLNWTGWWIFLFPLEIAFFQIGSKIVESSDVFYWWMWVFVPPLIGCHLLMMFGIFAMFIGKGTEGWNNFGEDPLEK